LVLCDVRGFNLNNYGKNAVLSKLLLTIKKYTQEDGCIYHEAAHILRIPTWVNNSSSSSAAAAASSSVDSCQLPDIAQTIIVARLGSKK